MCSGVIGASYDFCVKNILIGEFEIMNGYGYALADAVGIGKVRVCSNKGKSVCTDVIHFAIIGVAGIIDFDRAEIRDIYSLVFAAVMNGRTGIDSNFKAMSVFCVGADICFLPGIKDITGGNLKAAGVVFLV